MLIGNAFPSAYIKASDLQGKSVNIIMHSLEMQDIGGDIKPVLYFQGADGSKKERGMILNKTNANIITELHGSETDDWPGKMITLYSARVEFQGKIVDGIRVQLAPVGGASAGAAAKPRAPIRPPVAHNPRAMQTAPAETNGNGADHIDDEVPF